MAFPTSPSNNQVHKEGDRSFVYDSTSGAWDQINPTGSPSYDSIVGGRDIQKSSGSEQIVSVPLYDRNFTMYAKGSGNQGTSSWSAINLASFGLVAPMIVLFSKTAFLPSKIIATIGPEDKYEHKSS